jgi:hypothetical protein
MKIYGKGRSTRISSRRLTGKQKQRRLVSCQGVIQICQDNPTFLDCIFLFPKAKTAYKVKKSQNVEDITKTWRPNRTLSLWRPFLTVSKNFLNDSTNVFKLAEITSDINQTIFYFLVVFYLLFYTSPGTLLQDLVHEYPVAILQMTSTFTTNTGTFVSTTMLSINLASTEEGLLDSDGYLLLLLFLLISKVHKILRFIYILTLGTMIPFRPSKRNVTSDSVHRWKSFPTSWPIRLSRRTFWWSWVSVIFMNLRLLGKSISLFYMYLWFCSRKDNRTSWSNTSITAE